MQAATQEAMFSSHKVALISQVPPIIQSNQNKCQQPDVRDFLAGAVGANGWQELSQGGQSKISSVEVSNRE